MLGRCVSSLKSHGSVGVNPEEGHEDNQRVGAPFL